MYPVSDNYKTDIRKTVRNYSYMKVIVNMSDPQTASTNTSTDNGSVYYSDVINTDMGNSVLMPNATMEHNRLVLNGTQTFPQEIGDSSEYYQGYVGDKITNRDGDYVSRNMCPTDWSYWENNGYGTTGLKSVTAGRIRLIDKLTVTPSTRYYMNTFETNPDYDIRFLVRAYDINGVFIGSIGSVVNGTCITTNSDTYMISITVYTVTGTPLFSDYQTMFENGTIRPFICLDSNSDKSFIEYSNIPYPTVATAFSSYVNFNGISFKFDELGGSYPTEMQIIAYDNTTVVETTTHYPTSVDYTTPLGVPSSGYCNKIEVVFKKMSIPKRRMRLSYMVFGLIKEWTDNKIIKSTWNRNVDLLSTKLPTNSFEFTSIDINDITGVQEYNPDNPTGLWQYVEKLQPVSVLYGYELDSGNIEWINGANVYTTGEIKSESHGAIPTVTFYASSILNQLNDVYYKGVYSQTPVSLYSLAQNVLDFANSTQVHTIPYYIDPALNSIYTSIPLPNIATNKVLQLIANAGMCVLYVDRNGAIRIERQSTVLQDFELDLSSMKSTPMIEKIKPLLSVSTNYTTINKSAVSESLSKVSLSYSSPTQCILQYTPSVVNNATVTGTLSIIGAPVYYASSCVITVNGTGTLEIFGYKLSTNTTSVSVTTGNVGYDCPVSNSLINTKADATSYANWFADILNRRNQYTVDDRGFPELDTLDDILTESAFSSGLEATVTATKLSYNGTLSATTSFLTK